MHRLTELVRLHRLGQSARDLARVLRMGRNSVRVYLAALASAGLLDGPPEVLPDLAAIKSAVKQHAPRATPPQQQSSLESHAELIAEMRQHGAGPQAIYDCLRLRDAEFRGSVSAVKRLCRRIAGVRGIQPADVAIPVETARGEIAQVDFGYVGRLYDGRRGVLRRAWVFVMTLGYSRHLFADVVFDQRAATWVKLHVRAFSFFGGVPQVVVPDNLKAAVVRAAFAFDATPALHRTYCELARHYGFRVDPAPPRAPQKKGKVEANVKYVKMNFFRPRSVGEIEPLRAELRTWISEIAGRRVHGTTGRRPLEVFDAEERPALLPLPATEFELVTWAKAKVHRDSHVVFEKRLYSVPWPHVGREVWVRATDRTVTIHCDDERIATHAIRATEHRSTQDGHLPDHRTELRHRSRAYWEERAALLGEDVARFVRAVFESDDVLLNLRPVQAVVTHLRQFPVSRANAACARALAFGNLTYAGIKRILSAGLDLEPPAAVSASGVPPAVRPRFARSAAELLLPNLENLDERR